ncbi:ComEC/Rec2 family competence protein [Alkalihalobacillus sp. 1P02AB]|uniref:ComEC/Rec2 family competence protein n=1 Tax=Alkalihalobacillus sp. 1P02AB TaxID=3132260 RepID=UPI0039A64CAA
MLRKFLMAMVFVVFLSACSLEEIEAWIFIEETPSAPIVEGEAVVSFLDVGQGDSTLIQSEKTTILMDTGRHDSDVLFHQLEHLGIEKIDLLILTHPHADHIGNADQVIYQFSPDEVWIDGNEATTRTFERLLDALIETETPVVEPRAGEVYEQGDFLIEILHPYELTGHLNNDSISTRITYGEVTFLLTGDAEQRSEERMLESDLNLKSDIYKVGHHGSSTSNSRRFVEAVSPEVAIYSAESDNSYGHPHWEVVDLFDELGIDLYGTAEHGTITIYTDGETFDLYYE